MVLQRDQIQHIYGFTTPDTQIKGSFGAETFSGVSDSEGKFNIPLPVLPYGGPYTLTITGDSTTTYTDVLIGDVFLCGGQSNMEYTMGMLIDRMGFNEIQEDEDFVRHFDVPKVYNFNENVDFLECPSWQKAKGESLRTFSAIAYYAAKKLYKEHGVPVGIVNSDIGGTPAKSWTSQKTIREMNLYVDELEKALTPGYTQSTEERENKEEAQYLETADKTFETKDSLEKGKINFPGMFKDGLLAKLNGTVILRKKISIPKELAETDIDLYLGTIHDRDNTYVNGTFVGTTGYRYPTRRYHIPSGVLHEGENEIQINLTVFRGVGGVDDGKELFLAKAGTMTRLFDLEGEWEYEIKKELPTLNDKTFFIYYPSGLYQAMLYPIRNFNFRAAMYYQGESNVCFNKVYDKELRAMIGDWRNLFNKPELPFIIVQLAGYCDGDLSLNGSEWAVLREKQNEVSQDKNNYLVQAYDLGEYNDIHPCRKQEVGLRTARVLESIFYADDKLISNATNPKADHAEVSASEIKIYFKDIGDGIKDVSEVNNIQIITGEGIIKTSKGQLQNNILSVKHSGAKEILYAWSDCAFDVNLYGKNGLPVIPFKFEV